MTSDQPRQLLRSLMLVAFGAIAAVSATGGWGDDEQAAWDDSPSYWAVAAATYDGRPLQGASVIASVNINRGPTESRGGACYRFMLGTTDSQRLQRSVATTGEIRLGITSPVWLPGQPRIRTRCEPSPQLEYESKIVEIVEQADRWEWDGETMRILGPRLGHELRLVELSGSIPE